MTPIEHLSCDSRYPALSWPHDIADDIAGPCWLPWCPVGHSGATARVPAACTTNVAPSQPGVPMLGEGVLGALLGDPPAVASDLDGLLGAVAALKEVAGEIELQLGTAYLLLAGVNKALERRRDEGDGRACPASPPRPPRLNNSSRSGGS